LNKLFSPAVDLWLIDDDDDDYLNKLQGVLKNLSSTCET
jgi:hypothetical protein